MISMAFRVYVIRHCRGARGRDGGRQEIPSGGTQELLPAEGTVSSTVSLGRWRLSTGACRVCRSAGHLAREGALRSVRAPDPANWAIKNDRATSVPCIADRRPGCCTATVCKTSIDG